MKKGIRLSYYHFCKTELLLNLTFKILVILIIYYNVC